MAKVFCHGVPHASTYLWQRTHLPWSRTHRSLSTRGSSSTRAASGPKGSGSAPYSSIHRAAGVGVGQLAAGGGYARHLLGDLAAEGPGDGRRLGRRHRDDLPRAAVQAHPAHGGAGQGADRVEGDVAQLQPGVGAQVGLDRALQAVRAQRLAERRAPWRDLPAGLAAGEPGALHMPYDAGLFEFGGRVDHAADGPSGREHRTDRAVRVHTVEAAPVVGSAVPVEVPPGGAVLDGHDRRGAVQEWRDQRPARRVRVCLQVEEHVVGRAGFGRIVGGTRMRGEVAARAAHPDAELPHGRQVGSAGDEMHVGARTVERGAGVGADRPGAAHCDVHGGELRSVEGYRGTGKPPTGGPGSFRE